MSKNDITGKEKRKKKREKLTEDVRVRGTSREMLAERARERRFDGATVREECTSVI